MLPDIGEEPDELTQAAHESDKDSDEELSDSEESEDKQQHLIEAAMRKRFSLLKTQELRKKKMQNRKDMDKVAETYFEFYDELKKLRNLYLQKAQDHRHMVQEINIRDTLKVEGKLKRPLDEEQIAALKGMKLKVLRTRKVEIKKVMKRNQKPSLFQALKTRRMRNFAKYHLIWWKRASTRPKTD